MKQIGVTLIAILSCIAFAAQADVINAEKLARKYSAIAKSADAKYSQPSAMEGKHFFNRKNKVFNGKEMACASCHTSNPANPGKNIITSKAIPPLSPVIYSKRFNNLDKVEDQFTQHCNDIIGNDCTAREKANFITYLLTEKTPSAIK